jgi:hypothetical protein
MMGKKSTASATKKARRAHSCEPEERKRLQVVFLSEYALTGNLSHSARKAGIDRQTHYNWLQADGAYAAAFSDAEQAARDALEGEARRRAVDGTLKPVFWQGTQCGAIREFSDTLLIFLMKGAWPDKYRERWKGEISGPGDSPLTFTIRVGDRCGDAGD